MAHRALRHTRRAKSAARRFQNDPEVNTVFDALRAFKRVPEDSTSQSRNILTLQIFSTPQLIANRRFCLWGGENTNAFILTFILILTLEKSKSDLNN
jgi:hypothetical protein